MNKTKILMITAVSLFIVSSMGQSALGYGGPPEQSSGGNYTLEINFDKEMYDIGESITVFGNVNKYSEDRDLQITIFDSNSSLVLKQKFSANPDTTFSYTVTPNEKFQEGKYIVRAQYGTSKVTTEKVSFMISSNVSTNQTSSESMDIPDWIKNNAGWWAEGSIDDGSFVQGIQFLIKEGLMIIPITEQGSVSQDNDIPDWIKNNAGWWAEGSIDDGSFVQGIQFLIKEGLMTISQ